MPYGDAAPLLFNDLPLRSAEEKNGSEDKDQHSDSGLDHDASQRFLLFYYSFLNLLILHFH